MIFIECAGFPISHPISTGIILPSKIQDKGSVLKTVGSYETAGQERIFPFVIIYPFGIMLSYTFFLSLTLTIV